MSGESSLARFEKCNACWKKLAGESPALEEYVLSLAGSRIHLGVDPVLRKNSVDFNKSNELRLMLSHDFTDGGYPNGYHAALSLVNKGLLEMRSFSYLRDFSSPYFVQGGSFASPHEGEKLLHCSATFELTADGKKAYENLLRAYMCLTEKR
jgi:hypothetical protein